MSEYVKVELTDELKGKTVEILEKATKVKAGLNEVTKAVERGTAKLVVLAEDITPAELVMHIPLICEEKNIPCSYIATRKEIGRASCRERVFAVV